PEAMNTQSQMLRASLFHIHCSRNTSMFFTRIPPFPLPATDGKEQSGPARISPTIGPRLC
ncbi:unnamed protein product, partial [marine sediment metagenome]